MTSEGSAGSRQRKPAVPDVVYVVRPGDDNEELRHSLRSVTEHASSITRNVWIVGSVPSWVKGVKTIPLVPQDDKFLNQRQSLHAIAARPEISDHFVLFNDDMFIVEPLSEWKTWNLYTFEDHFGGPVGNVDKDSNEWLHAVWMTYKWMQGKGFADPLYYENHTPLLFSRSKLAEVLAEYPPARPFVVNGVYEIAGAGGEGDVGGNVKLHIPGEATTADVVEMIQANAMPYMSTEDKTSWLSAPGDYVRQMFPTPCKFEKKVSS